MPVTLWPMRQPRERLGDCLAIRYGVPPLGGAAPGPPEGGTTNHKPGVSMGFSKHVLRACVKIAKRGRARVRKRPPLPGPLLQKRRGRGFLRHFLILALILNSLHVCAQEAGFGPAISVPHDLPEARLGSLPPRNR